MIPRVLINMKTNKKPPKQHSTRLEKGTCNIRQALSQCYPSSKQPLGSGLKNKLRREGWAAQRLFLVPVQLPESCADSSRLSASWSVTHVKVGFSDASAFESSMLLQVTSYLHSC